MIEIRGPACPPCTDCQRACPLGLIAAGPVLKPEAERYCIDCGHCYAVCPTGAISFVGEAASWPLPKAAATELPPSEVPVESAAMLELLRRRRSRRSYAPTPVSRAHLERILEAAALAPSSHNGHLVRVRVYQSEHAIAELANETRRYYRRLLRLFGLPGFAWLWRLAGFPPERLPDLSHRFSYVTSSGQGEDPIFRGARTVLVLTAPAREREAHGDSYLAAANAVVLAEALGIGTCFNNFLVVASGSRAVRRALGVGKSEKVLAALMLGYPAPSPAFRRVPPRRPLETIWIG